MEQPPPAASAARPTKLAVRDLYKVFGPNPDRAVALLEAGASKRAVQDELGLAVGVADVSLDIKAGETFVLMGLSGSGKSTLLRLLNRLHEPTSGSITVDDVEITGLSRNELLRVRREKFSGMVFQQFAVLPHRTVAANVAYGLEVQGVREAERRERSLAAIELVGLSGWESHYPHQLSGGMQQRVGLARALAVDADILLMDEAFSALDPLIRREMQDELLELQSRVNKTIVFVTHDLDEALKLGDRIAIMKDARVVQVELGCAVPLGADGSDDQGSHQCDDQPRRRHRPAVRSQPLHYPQPSHPSPPTAGSSSTSDRLAMGTTPPPSSRLTVRAPRCGDHRTRSRTLVPRRLLGPARPERGYRQSGRRRCRWWSAGRRPPGLGRRP